jgi:hypothetical protein
VQVLEPRRVPWPSSQAALEVRHAVPALQS